MQLLEAGRAQSAWMHALRQHSPDWALHRVTLIARQSRQSVAVHHRGKKRRVIVPQLMASSAKPSYELMFFREPLHGRFKNTMVAKQRVSMRDASIKLDPDAADRKGIEMGLEYTLVCARQAYILHPISDSQMQMR